MSLLTLSWCSFVGLASKGLFPEICIFHVCLGLMTMTLSGIINYFVTKFAVEKFDLKYIQPSKRGENIIDESLYNVYVITTAVGTVYFAAWPWAVIPTLENIYWKLNSMTIFNTIGSFLLSMLIYDFIYYLGHVLMHKDSNFYKHIHKVHHQLTAPGNMFDNLYIHPLELFIFLWPQVLPIYILNMHIIAVYMYFFTIFTVTSMYHMGIKFPSFLPLLSPEFHDNHHKLNVVNFSFFTELPDIIFKTNR